MTLDWLRHLPIAHRGLHGDGAAENSRASFEAAIAAGFAIELDVRCSADGVPVVFHDETLDRMTGTPGRVDERTTDELRALHITTLHDALGQIGGRTPLLVEVKPIGPEGERLTAALLASYAGRLALQSFDPCAVRRLKDLLPGCACGLLAETDAGLAPATSLRPDFIAYDLSSPSRLKARRVASSLGIPFIVWTSRTRAERAIAAELGANRIFEGEG